jgi:hypothetical protein
MLTQQRSVLVLNRPAVPLYKYYVYGIALHSDFCLDLPTQGSEDAAQIDLSLIDLPPIELRNAPPSCFFDAQRELTPEQDSDSWSRFATLPDTSTYVRWEGVGEFLVSACGHHIQARQFEEAGQESFHVYLLGQALSFALVNSGLEPLHATTVVVNGEAVAFLGESGFGKSTLAACFLQAGYRMLTDDLLILKDDLLILKKDSDTFIAYPGPLRIKLYPHLAHRFLGTASNGVAMNSESRKLILPLCGARASSAPAPLKALYTLAAPRQMSRKQPIRISVLPPREGFMALVKNTFNSRIVHPARLERQFQQMTRLASVVPVKELSYPRVLADLPKVRDAILADLNFNNLSYPNEKEAVCGD